MAIVRGAVGTLSNGKPKWYKYNSSDYPFVVGSDVFNAVIVEDCVSACAVAPIHTGIAIMGTSYQINTLNISVVNLEKFISA